ncbi:MAG: hypothetical protein ACQES5_04770 [Thermodesulfobacteriota bacterium]
MIPKFNTYHSNLYGSFLLFEKYVQFLKNEYLNGYIYLDDHKNKIYVFMFEGEIINCLKQTNSTFERLNFNQTKNFVQDQTTVSSFRCGTEHVDFFSKFNTLKLLHSDLSSDIVNPEKLIQKCKTEKFNGVIELKSDKDTILLYFLQGQLLGNTSSSKENFFDHDPKEKIITQDNSETGTINIYRISLNAEEKTDNREKMIECFEKIFNALENSSKDHNFASCWRQCALELGDKYAFLDPFAEEFNYTQGNLEIWEKINSKTLAHGLNELVQQIKSRTKCPDTVVDEIKQKYSEELADYEI